MIQAASGQLSELLDDLGLVARLEDGRYAPSLVEADTLELAQAAASRLGEKAVGLRSRRGGSDRSRCPSSAGWQALALCALRHGGLERVELTADGPPCGSSP